MEIIENEDKTCEEINKIVNGIMIHYKESREILVALTRVKNKRKTLIKSY